MLTETTSIFWMWFCQYFQSVLILSTVLEAPFSILFMPEITDISSTPFVEYVIIHVVN